MASVEVQGSRSRAIPDGGEQRYCKPKLEIMIEDKTPTFFDGFFARELVSVKRIKVYIDAEIPVGDCRLCDVA